MTNLEGNGERSPGRFWGCADRRFDLWITRRSSQESCPTTQVEGYVLFELATKRILICASLGNMGYIQLQVQVGDLCVHRLPDLHGHIENSEDVLAKIQVNTGRE